MEPLKTVASPVGPKDYWIAVKNLFWQFHLDGQKPYHLFIFASEGLKPKQIKCFFQLARMAFQEVSINFYKEKGIKDNTNFLFTECAKEMAMRKSAWLYFEYDAIPMKRGWLEELAEKYKFAGKPFYGPIVPDRGHMNGVSVYPSNTPDLIPKAMQIFGVGVDIYMKDEMIHLAADASPFIFHAWGMVDGKIHHIDGVSPSFTTAETLDLIPKDCLLCHRCKDGTLIDRLCERNGMILTPDYV